MTQTPATPAADSGLPKPGDVYTDSLILLDLLTALDGLSDRVGPEGGPVSSLILVTLPRMQKLTDDLEALYDR